MWEGSTPGASTKICHRLASAIERGAGSFSAEQFIEILRLFNVPVSHVASEARADPDSALQNLLARLGASELHESDALPSERILDFNEAIRQTLVTGSPRLVAALAPVLVRNANRVSLPRVDSSLRELRPDRRLPWLVENVIEAVRKELPRARSSAIEYRRALVVLVCSQTTLPTRCEPAVQLVRDFFADLDAAWAPPRRARERR